MTVKEAERKLEHKLPATQLGQYLRELATVLEGHSATDFYGLNDNLGAYSKIELKIRRKNNQVVARLKVKSAAGASEAGEKTAPLDGKPKYKALKKRMKPVFKTISESAARDEFPAAEVVKSFVADSAVMLTYPGKGDEYYGAYRKALDDFAQAFENQDFVTFKQAHGRLEQLKDACHERYK
jgi:XXXCH domain-containing protein